MTQNELADTVPTRERKQEEDPAHRLNELMQGFRVAMLVTSENGQLRARPMTVAEVTGNEVWFSTSVGTSKVEEVKTDPNVLVTMQSDTRYVSIGGPCTISKDANHIARLWSESWRIWFPKGPQDPELVLMRVRVDQGEFWDLQGTKGIRFVWEAVKAYFSGEKVADIQSSHGTI